MPFFGLSAVESALRRVADELRGPIGAYVFGGGAMAAWGVKPATRDLDVAFRRPVDRDAFGRALLGLKATGPAEPRFQREGARHLYQTPDGLGWDLFVDNVLGFRLGPSDFDGAETWMRAGPLEVFRFRPELVFVMKAFTPRTRDISDMYELLQRGTARPARIVELVRQRIGDDPRQPWIAPFYQGVVDMARDRHVRIDWVDEFHAAATASLEANRGPGSKSRP